MFGPKIQAEEIITLNNVVRKNGSFEYAVNRGGKKVEQANSWNWISLTVLLSPGGRHPEKILSLRLRLTFWPRAAKHG